MSILLKIPEMNAQERKNLRANAETMLMKGAPQKIAQAQSVIEALDQQLISDEENRETYIASQTEAERIVEAFRKTPATATEEKLVLALLNNPGATSQTLSEVCQYKGGAWHLHFGKMGSKRQAYLSATPVAVKQKKEFWTGLFADYDATTQGFTMRSDAAESFAELGLKASAR